MCAAQPASLCAIGTLSLLIFVIHLLNKKLSIRVFNKQNALNTYFNQVKILKSCSKLYFKEQRSSYDTKRTLDKRPKGPHIVHLSTMCHLFD